MSGPVKEALGTGTSAGSDLGVKYAKFRDASHAALGEEMTGQIRHAVARVHGLENAPGDTAPMCSPPEDTAWLAYARRMPFEHTAITDEEAAAVVSEIGEEGYVAFSVVAALADAECRAEKIDLPGLARSK